MPCRSSDFPLVLWVRSDRLTRGTCFPLRSKSVSDSSQTIPPCWFYAYEVPSLPVLPTSDDKTVLPPPTRPLQCSSRPSESSSP